MSHLPTLRQLQFLLALKEQGGFQAAAQACHVTQSTLSAGIKDMEILLGRPVIDRSNRKKLIFTPLGLALLSTGQNVITQLSSVTSKKTLPRQPFAWPLKMGMIPTIAPYWLPDILAPLQKRFPDLKLHIHEQQSIDLVQAVQNGTLDFGILALPFQTHDLEIMPLYKENFVCAAPKNLFKGRKHVTMKDLEQQQLLLLSEGHCLRDHMLSVCHLPRNHDQNVSATSLATIIQLVAQNYGVTLLPQMVVKSGLLPRQIDILPFSPSATREVALIWRPNSVLKNEITLLGKALKALSA